MPRPAARQGIITNANFHEGDLIGRVYEYFLQAFAVNAEKEEGEFYTPHCIVELISSLIEPFDGTLYAPACGSGGMFVLVDHDLDIDYPKEMARIQSELWVLLDEERKSQEELLAAFRAIGYGIE